ncbi:PIR protein [Plasmodium vivax]|nr:PIR protein [Plasmodium vivax]
MSLVDLGYYKDNRGDLSEISDLLKKLPLYNFYDKLDNELGNNEATGNCKECNTKLSGTSPEELRLLALCKSFCNIISKGNVFNKHCKDSSCNIYCTYINFWLYSKVIEITITSTIIEKFYKALERISKIPISDMEFCEIKNYNKIHDNFKNLKYLYEFLFSYYDLNKKISPQLNGEDRLYCNHIKENFRFYNDIKESCTNLRSCPYKTELGKFEQIFSDGTELSDIYSKCNYEQTSCIQNSIKINDIPCLKEKEITLPFPIINLHPDKVVNKIINGVSYSIPTLATLTMLYKFTPLGSWLYSKIKRTNNIEKKINAENYYISHHNTRIEEIDPGNSSNNTY